MQSLFVWLAFIGVVVTSFFVGRLITRMQRGTVTMEDVIGHVAWFAVGWFAFFAVLALALTVRGIQP